MVMHSDEKRHETAIWAQPSDSKREMLRLKTPSVGKLFNYLRYCGRRVRGEAATTARKFVANRRDKGGWFEARRKRTREYTVMKRGRENTRDFRSAQGASRF